MNGKGITRFAFLFTSVEFGITRDHIILIIIIIIINQNNRVILIPNFIEYLSILCMLFIHEIKFSTSSGTNISTKLIDY